MQLKLDPNGRHGASGFFRILEDAISYRVAKPVTKAILFHNHGSYPLCPRCEISLEREYMLFCDRCGQRLSWRLFPLKIIHRTHTHPKKETEAG